MTTSAPTTNRRAKAVVLAATAALMLSLLPFVSASAAVPAAPSAPDLAPASDTGTSNADNITKTLNGLGFTGTAEPGSTVKIYVGGSTEIGSSVATAGGAWSVTTTVAVPDNKSNLITATATNADGPSPRSAPLTVTTDNKVPGAPSKPNLDAASDTGTSSSDNITSDTTPTFSGTSEAGATVELRANGLPVATVIASGTHWQATSIALGAGTYSFTALQSDVAGNGPSVPSGGLTVTINQTGPPPPSAPDLVPASDTGPSSTDNITSDTTPTFTGTTVAGTRVQLFAGATLVGTDNSTSSGAWQITVSPALADGTYIFTATATDVNGTSVASPGLQVTIQVVHFIVTASTNTPGAGAAVTISAQLVDAANVAVPTAGLVVTWSKTGAGGSFSPTTSTTNASGIATTTFTVSATPGTIHTVTATSPGGITGTSANITVQIAVASLTLISIDEGPQPGLPYDHLPNLTNYRQFVALTAVFSGTGGANRLVSFQRMTPVLPGTWVTIGSATTNAAGRATLRYGPPYNTQFRAVWAGAPDLAAATSNTILVNVRHKVTLRPGSGVTREVPFGTRLTYIGTTRPIAPAGLQRITFLIYKRINGVWTFKTSATIATVNGVASFSWTWGHGQWYVRARGNATVYNLTAYSGLSKVIVP